MYSIVRIDESFVDEVRAMQQARQEAAVSAFAEQGASGLVRFLRSVGLPLAQAVSAHAEAVTSVDGFGEAICTIEEVDPDPLVRFVVGVDGSDVLVATCPDLTSVDISRGRRPLLFSAPVARDPAAERLVSSSCALVSSLIEFSYWPLTLGAVMTSSSRSSDAQRFSASTTDQLPGTIYCDLVTDERQLGEVIVHECAHVWLNECMAALNVRLPKGIRVYSPWKQRERPLVLYAQAVFAFSRVAHYQTLLLESNLVPEPWVPYWEKRLDWSRRHLRLAQPGVVAGLAAIADRRIRHLITHSFEVATRP